MKQRYYILKEEDGNFLYSSCNNFSEHTDLKNVCHDLKIRILKHLSKKPMYPSELAKKLKINEQKLYYHINNMIKSGILEIIDREEIRGTVAKILKPKDMNFSFCLDENWHPLSELKAQRNKVLEKFFSEFNTNGIFNGQIVVGNPDPHGPFKARARDGHYAIDLAMCLGNMMNLPTNFSATLDVDFKLRSDQNTILVGGPVANLLVSKVNTYLPVKFSDKKPWGIISERTKRTYSEETNGLIAKVNNPFSVGKKIIVFAGISAVGTKAAVIALTRHYSSLLQNFNNQDSWGAIINGFDLDGDGRIDSAEIVE